MTAATTTATTVSELIENLLSLEAKQDAAAEAMQEWLGVDHKIYCENDERFHKLELEIHAIVADAQNQFGLSTSQFINAINASEKN